MKERMSGKPLPDHPTPTPLPDEMITRIAEHFGANARHEERTTVEAKKHLRFIKPEPALR
jgi:hypothetical protein